MDRKLCFSIDNKTSDFVSESPPVTGAVDVNLQKIHTQFAGETSASLTELEQGLRAWTRSHFQDEDINKVIALATRAREEFSVLVIIGIGGSDLSARVFHDSFNHPYHNLLSVEDRGGAPEVYFTGDTFDPRKLVGLLEMLKARHLLQKTLFNVISKSGTTTETMATLMIIRETTWQWKLAATQVLATTGLTDDSVLFRMHEKCPFYGGTLLPVPDGVGGRFSAFSPVGLFFLAMTAGKNETSETRIRIALEGVQQAHEDFYRPCDHQGNVAYHLARWIHLAEVVGRQRFDSVFYNYADNSCLGEWFVQLCTESIQERGTGSKRYKCQRPYE